MEGGGLDPEPSRGSSSDSLEPESDGRVPDSDGYAPAGPVTIVWIYTQQTWSKTKKRSGTTYTGHGTTTVHTCTYVLSRAHHNHVFKWLYGIRTCLYTEHSTSVLCMNTSCTCVRTYVYAVCYTQCVHIAPAALYGCTLKHAAHLARVHHR